MKSILQDKRECYITGRTDSLHRHHIYGGSRRKASEKWGCWVYLIGDYHNQSAQGVHFNPKLDQQLKRICQKEFELRYGREKFMELFGKNYLEE